MLILSQTMHLNIHRCLLHSIGHVYIHIIKGLCLSSQILGVGSVDC